MLVNDTNNQFGRQVGAESPLAAYAGSWVLAERIVKNSEAWLTSRLGLYISSSNLLADSTITRTQNHSSGDCCCSCQSMSALVRATWNYPCVRDRGNVDVVPSNTID